MGFITVDGENQIAAKQGASQLLNVTSFVLANIDGLGAEPANRVEAMPAGADIMATLPVTTSGYVNTNQIVYSLVMDSSLGDYDFNWVGLVDDEGELIAVTYTPLIQKRKTAGAVPGNNLTRNFLIAYSGIQATAAIAVPAETWQIDFNARLHGIDERERLSNFDVYGHEGFIGDGYSVVRQGATTTYDVLAGVGYVGGIRIVSAIAQQVVVGAPPSSIWLDISLEGDISDVSAVTNFVVSAVAENDYVDGNGFNHYLTKICEIAADGTVTDVRVLSFLDEVNVEATPEVKAEGQNWEGIAYIDPDAIGANPTAKIYPDGTIVGSTDNGSYIKYPNGRKEVTGSVTPASNNNSGTVWTYPLAFTTVLHASAGADYVTSGGAASSSVTEIGSINPTNIKVKVLIHQATSIGDVAATKIYIKVEGV